MLSEGWTCPAAGTHQNRSAWTEPSLITKQDYGRAAAAGTGSQLYESERRETRRYLSWRVTRALSAWSLLPWLHITRVVFSQAASNHPAAFQVLQGQGVITSTTFRKAQAKFTGCDFLQAFTIAFLLLPLQSKVKLS